MSPRLEIDAESGAHAGAAPTNIKARLLAFLAEHGSSIAWLVAVQVGVYTYFFSTLIFTNHTFPNAWVVSFPSPITRQEGRWLSDFVIWLQGGSGVRSLQMFLATALQAVNGILFARLFGAKGRMDVMLLALAVCLYPAFLDDYAFERYHLSFILGDTLALCALAYCAGRPASLVSAAVGSLLIMLSLALYQPKIAFVLLLGCCHLTAIFSSATKKKRLSLSSALGAIAYVAAIIAAGTVLYLASSKIAIQGTHIPRAHLNSMHEMALAILSTYKHIGTTAFPVREYLPPVLGFVPAGVVLVGGWLLLKRAMPDYLAVMLVAFLLLCIPLCARASFIINKNTWEDAGRITYVSGYALLFFIAAGLQSPQKAKLFRGAIALFIYFFVVVDSQASNAAAFKTTYELSFINRIAARIESVTPDLYSAPHALIVLGRFPALDHAKFCRFLPFESHSQCFLFEVYRQQELMNLVVGHDAFRRPSPKEVKAALAATEGRKPWPSSESVFVLKKSVVVLLEKYRPDLPHTWSVRKKKKAHPSGPPRHAAG